MADDLAARFADYRAQSIEAAERRTAQAGQELVAARRLAKAGGPRRPLEQAIATFQAAAAEERDQRARVFSMARRSADR